MHYGIKTTAIWHLRTHHSTVAQWGQYIVVDVGEYWVRPFTKYSVVHLSAFSHIYWQCHPIWHQIYLKMVFLNNLFLKPINEHQTTIIDIRLSAHWIYFRNIHFSLGRISVSFFQNNMYAALVISNNSYVSHVFLCYRRIHYS